jgi:hypothetical protein
VSSHSRKNGVESNPNSNRPRDAETSGARHQEVSPDATATLLLTAAEWAAQTRAELDVKDKSYRRYPLGQEVGRFLRSLRVERRAQATRDSYETTLRRLVLDHRDYESLAQFTTDDLYAFLDRHWGDSEGDTMGQRAACIRSFFAWATRSGRLERNPAEAIRVPRIRRRLRLARDLTEIRTIAAAQSRDFRRGRDPRHRSAGAAEDGSSPAPGSRRRPRTRPALHPPRQGRETGRGSDRLHRRSRRALALALRARTDAG